MSATKQDALPAYQQIQQALREQIKNAQLKPGDAVPSERELARMHGVSPLTARHALDELALEGLVERRPGSGTFVAPMKIQPNKLVSFTEQMVSRGFSAHSRLLFARVVEGEYEITARLAVPSETALVKLERLRMGDGQPFALEICYLPAERFAALTNAALDRRSLFTVLEQEYGVELAYADEEVDATTADHRIAELLKVRNGAPLLRIRQVLYSTSGEPTVYSLALYRSDRYSLITRRHRKPGAPARS